MNIYSILYIILALKTVGLSGDEKVIDIGDINNLIPVIKREKLYNVRDLKQITGSDPLCIIGPCGGPYPLIGVDSEVSIYYNIIILF